MDIELLPSDPLKSIRKLNEAVGQRKNRRALTAEEVERFLQAAKTRKCRTKGKADERLLVYNLLLGTGLRSTELSLLTPSQIDFEHCRLTIEAAKTKKKKDDVLPIRADLVQSLKKWVETHGIQPHDRIFRYNRYSIRSAFCRDLKAAGIERVGADGRSLDVHSLRKTFGTMLARAGVPLTTVQRLMRHSTPLLTAKLYIDVDPVDMTQALDKLPVFQKRGFCEDKPPCKLSVVPEGIDINTKNDNGATPLHTNASVSNEFSQYLISVGADKSAKNNAGDTPADVEEERRLREEEFSRYGS